MPTRAAIRQAMIDRLTGLNFKFYLKGHPDGDRAIIEIGERIAASIVDALIDVALAIPPSDNKISVNDNVEVHYIMPFGPDLWAPARVTAIYDHKFTVLFPGGGPYKKEEDLLDLPFDGVNTKWRRA